MSSLPPYQDLGQGIFCIDTGYGRAGLAACYLVVSGDRAAFIDTGTANTAPSLLALLEHLGMTPRQVRYVIPTHVHLDHAGGAGQLMAACEEAELVTHPRGAPHMIDPSRLTAGATAVYGEAAFARDFGALLPIAEERVIAADDGRHIDLAGRTLTFFDTPGHANHHVCVWDERSRGFFTGDTFGIAYPELATGQGPWLFAPTTPVAFDPERWHASVERLMAQAPEVMYLTHFGAVAATSVLADRLHHSIDSLAATARDFAGHSDVDRLDLLRQAVRDLLVGEARAQGVGLAAERILELLSMDIDLNAQGLNVWLARQQRKTAD